MTEEQTQSFQYQPSDHQQRRNGSGSANLPEAKLYPDAGAGSVIHARSTFEPVLDSEEAAALLHIHPKTLQRLARNGEIPGFPNRKALGFPCLGIEPMVRKQAGGLTGGLFDKKRSAIRAGPPPDRQLALTELSFGNSG